MVPTREGLLARMRADHPDLESILVLEGGTQLGAADGQGQGQRQEGSAEAAVILADAFHRPQEEATAASLLRRLAARLPTGAPVLIALPAETPNRELRSALAEAGFLLRRRGAGGIWRARRDRFRIRGYRPGDEDPVLGLFEQAFHEPRDLAHWRWLYEENPAGRHRLTVAEDQDGSLVAHYSGYPLRFFRSPDEWIDAHQIGDTMTLPAVRHLGRGPTSLLARTGSYFFDRFCRGRVGFNYGFNTGNIQRFSERFLGAVRIADVEAWQRCRPSAQEVLATWNPTEIAGLRAVPLTEDTLKRRSQEIDRLFDQAAPAYGFLAHRSAAYLRWRYAGRPGNPYYLVGVEGPTPEGSQLVGWAAFRREGERLVWGDALVHPQRPAALSLLLADTLAALEGDPSAAGVHQITAWFGSARPWLEEALAHLGFERYPDPLGLALMCLPFEDKYAPEALRTLYYTLGDSDLF